MIVTASLVLYNTKESEIKTLMECVSKSRINKLFVVDHSADDSRRSLFGNCGNVEYELTPNTGYGAGHNVAIRKLDAEESDFHLILNPDIIFKPEAIDVLVEYMSADGNQDVGLSMPLVKYPNGDMQYLCKLLPTPADIFLRQFAPGSIKKKLNRKYALEAADYSKEMHICSLSGCFMFFRTSVLKKIGGFDERFFLHFEDIDISRRASEISRTMYIPSTSIIHAHAAEHKKSKKVLLISLKSGIKYFNKWGWLFDNYRSRENKRVKQAYLK